MKLIVKYFLLDFYFWEVVLDLGKYILPWQICLFWGVILDQNCLAFG